ncbi:MAG: ATP-binding protein [Pseudanabaenales cyanobacterium]|nr:ATP-binding protein [Pseudanabaenales cyanobacterium]
MSSDPPPSFSGDWFKHITQAAANLIRWIAELIQRRDWFMLLVMVGVGLSISGVFFRKTLNEWLPDEHENALWAGVILVIGLSFVGALVVAVTTMPRPRRPKPADMAERRAIKGLRAFSFADAEIFAQLQRCRSLRECLESVTSDAFRFGILMGDSGCGKTSFLQAGLWAQLSDPESAHRGIYIRFSDQDPLVTIRKALADQLQLPPSTDKAFLPLLEQAVNVAAKPLVLLFDQFEQFFVHYTRESDRASFIQALADWYRHPDPHPVKVLVSIRSDLMHQLDDLHKALGYALGPQDVFRLKKFTPAEAAKVLGVIAETEQLAFDERFVTEIAQQELAIGRMD